jgi:hypothetical protein
MLDEAAIANMSAALLGDDSRLINLDEDSVLARTFKEAWQPCRLAVLRVHPWNFALKRVALPSRVLANDETIFPWAYAFPLPAEMLRLHDVVSPDLASEEWSRESRDILSMSEGPLIVRGVFDQPVTALWDHLFTDAFAAYLAFVGADRITGDRARRSDMWAHYQSALKRARSVDGRENPPIPASYEASSWVTARYGA